MSENVSFLVVAPSSEPFDDDVLSLDYLGVKRYINSSCRNYFKIWVSSKSGFVRFLGDCSNVDQFNRLVRSDEFVARANSVLRSEKELSEKLHSTLVLS
jgi:hypothetical protein